MASCIDVVAGRGSCIAESALSDSDSLFVGVGGTGIGDVRRRIICLNRTSITGAGGGKVCCRFGFERVSRDSEGRRV